MRATLKALSTIPTKVAIKKYTSNYDGQVAPNEFMV